ncbi:MAG: hypothetical protein U0168_06535 [Nannocystaceae bacterium]
MPTTFRRGPPLDRCHAAAFALVGGLLRILASAVLGMERLDALTAASQEGRGCTSPRARASTLGSLALWILRRPLVAAIRSSCWRGRDPVAAVAAHVLVGLALHGEFLLHFIATACACAAVVRAGGARDRGRKAVRWPAAACLLVTAIAGVWGHLAEVRGAVRAEQLAHGVVVISTLAAAGLLIVRELLVQPRSLRAGPRQVLLAPPAVQALASGPFALARAPVPPELRAPFLGLLVLSAARC